MPEAEAKRVFDVVDTFDPDRFVLLLSQDARLVFGNAEPMVGREAIAEGLRAFFATIGGLSHRIVRAWRSGADTVAETEVTYRRLDGKDASVVAVSIWSAGEDGLIHDYRIFADLAPVYA